MSEELELSTRVEQLEKAVMALSARILTEESLGDSQGHAFHGNQYGGGGDSDTRTPKSGDVSRERAAELHDTYGTTFSGGKAHVNLDIASENGEKGAKQDAKDLAERHNVTVSGFRSDSSPQGWPTGSFHGHPQDVANMLHEYEG